MEAPQGAAPGPDLARLPTVAAGDAVVSAVAVPAITVRRLAPPMPADRWGSWAATAFVVAIAAALRLLRLDQPRGKLFDEIYYATDAHNLLRHGVEWDEATNSAGYVVHPPLGKWLIAIGEQVFGYNELGWRIPSALAGTLAVLILVRAARRLFRSTVLGCAAGLLMALDGLQLVLSRLALLDIFLLLFVLAAFACLIVDRDLRRLQRLRALRAGLDRPPLAMPWWRLAAAVLTGCAMGVKWSGVWYALAFVVLICFWEAGARRSGGVSRPWRAMMREESRWLLAFGTIAMVVYLATWSGWLAGDTGWDRHWLESQGRTEPPFLGALENLYHYHRAMLHTSDGISTPHRYQSWPWQWLLLGRPVLVQWACAETCTSTSPMSTVLMLGTPALWWSFIPALVGLAWLGISRRDWRAAAIGLGAGAGIVPWMPFQALDRTMFAFYAAPAEPFLILGVVYVAGVLIRRSTKAASSLGAVLAGGYVLVVAANFAYFYPIYTGDTITYAQWMARMWLGARWI
ncbi:dolichyl-phosphate-mannose--protein mannosyltransferase [Dactylosporangium sp. CA-052675]|uniref:dolichyl-phosphate-mannose--protein mannosyltransferase n=1 Tax=Dactylosporangium sp. CA-052675 TaxID=3239927 RepID=UPI003D9240DF